MHMKLPKAILLDLDDTITAFDDVSERIWEKVSRDFTDMYGTPFDSHELLAKIHEKRAWYWSDPQRHKSGRSNLPEARRVIMKMVLQELGIPAEDKAFALADAYSVQHDAAIRLMDGAKEALERFASMGIRMSVITNGSPETQWRKINRFGLSGFFECVIIDEEVGVSKPDPRIFALALEKLSLPAEDVWMVGDNLLWDVEGAQRMGIFAVWNDYRQKGLPEDSTVKPDLTVTSIFELSQIIGKREARYDVILMDADNTLFDFSKAEATALDRAFFHYGYEYSDTVCNAYREINKKLWKQLEGSLISVTELQYQRFFRLFTLLDIEEDPTEFNLHYLDELADCSQLVDGAEDICRLLQRHCRLAIVTNGVSKTQHRRIDQSSVKDCFEAVFVSGDIGCQKPQKEFFDVVFADLNIPDPDRVLIVGDSLASDILGGNNAGIAACWYNPNGAQNETMVIADYEIQSLYELNDIIFPEEA